MKKLLLLIFSAVCLASCTLKETISNVFNPSSQNNYDDDPVTTITTDTGSNSYDKEIQEENVEIPSEYDGTNLESISVGGKYYYSGTVSKIDITKKDIEVYLFFDGVTIECDTGIAVGSKNIACHLVLMR